MNKFGLAFAAAFAGIAPALAQTPPVSIPASAYGPVWTGFYVGGAIGAGALVERANTASLGANFNVDGLGGQGVLGSVYGGVDYQILPRALVGVLAELSYGGPTMSSNAQVPGAGASVSTRSDLSWAVLLRAGVLATPSTLLYATGGYTGQTLHTDASAFAGGAFGNASRDDTFNGWTVGGGIETMLGRGWATKLEYRYSQYEQKAIANTGFNLQPNTHIARIGVSYKFGGLADDRPQADAPLPERTTNWTAVYGGVAGGGGALVNRIGASAGGASANTDAGAQGLLGSVFIGGDYQFAEQALVGVMGDLTWAGLQSTDTVSGGGGAATFTTRANMAWSVLGRLGFLPSPSTLLYAAGGFTSESFTNTASVQGGGLFASATRDDTLSGWTLGPGVEMIIADGWSTRLEYRYSQFETRMVNGVSFQPQTHAVRAGLAYRFGVGPAGH